MAQRHILFQGKVTDTGSSLELSIALVSALIFAILTAIAFFDARLGGPFYYLPIFLIAAAAAYMIIRRMSAVVTLARDDDGMNVIEVKGSRHDITMRLVGEHSFWYSRERTKIRHGGYTMVRYNLLLSGPAGERLGFRMEAGRGGGEPATWLHREEYLHDGPRIFHIMNIVALLRALEIGARSDSVNETM